jgi:hypothetical protein
MLRRVISVNPEHNLFCTYYTLFADVSALIVGHFQLYTLSVTCTGF